MPSTIRSKKNLIFVLVIVFALLLIATMRVGYVQLVKGEEYKDRALSQQTTDIVVEAERGIIYDRNEEKLAQSVKCFDVYVYPAEIGKYNDCSSEEQQKLVESGELVPSYMWNQNGWLCKRLGLTPISQIQKERLCVE